MPTSSSDTSTYRVSKSISVHPVIINFINQGAVSEVSMSACNGRTPVRKAADAYRGPNSSIGLPYVREKKQSEERDT